MTIMHRIDQLNIDRDAISFPAYAPFQNIGCAKGLTDFPQALPALPLSIAFDRRSTDDT